VKILFVMNHGGTNAMAAGQHTAADAMITAAGAQNAMQGFSRYRPLAQEGIIASAPDILMVTTDGVRSLGGIEQVWKLPGVALTPAGKNHRVLVLDDMALLGFRQQEGEKLIATYRQKLAVVPHSPLPVKILFVMNHGGTNAMAAGQHTAADAMITAAGAQNAMQGFSRYRPLAQEGIIASAPDILMVTTDGVRSLGGIEQVWKLPGVALTPAGKNHRVLVLDDMALLGFGLETPDVLVKIRQAAEQVK